MKCVVLEGDPLLLCHGDQPFINIHTSSEYLCSAVKLMN